MCGSRASEGAIRGSWALLANGEASFLCSMCLLCVERVGKSALTLCVLVSPADSFANSANPD